MPPSHIIVGVISDTHGLLRRAARRRVGRSVLGPDLRRGSKRKVVVGGGELAHSLFEAGLIDEIGFNIHPVLLGSGIPLYHPMSRQIDLELQECRPFANGCVYVTYRVKH